MISGGKVRVAGAVGVAAVLVASDQPAVLVEHDDGMANPVDRLVNPIQLLADPVGQRFLRGGSVDLVGDVDTDAAIANAPARS
jgi:hypothetical protein